MRYVGPRQIVIDDQPAPVPFWEPDRAYEGETVVLIGGGPSHAAIDIELLAGRHFIAINSGCRKVRPVARPDTMLYFSDNSWAENRHELLVDWPGPLVTSNRNTKARLGDMVCRINMDTINDLFPVPLDFPWASSGHSAACLSVVMGARRIVLIGFEGQAVDGKTHGHADYGYHDPSVYADRFLPAWTVLAPQFERHGVEVINATPQSAIKDFSFVPFAEALGPV